MFAVSRTVIFSPQGAQVRHSSGKLKELALRLKSIKNIQKITKTMKMISAAKYAQAEKALRPARVYGTGALAVFNKTEIPTENTSPKQLMIACTSDRGLCGPLHANIVRAMNSYVEELPDEVETKVVTIGDKSKLILQVTNPKDMLMECKELGRIAPNFTDASAIAEGILDSDFKFDHGKVFYNYFKSAMSQIITQQPIYSSEAVAAAPTMAVFDSVDADVLQSYQEFQLVNTIYYTLKENYASEQGARMVCMDGATKNAGEIIDKMTLLYNRSRQAVITTELIEIISGMAAL
ncbi:ATP synthase F(1) complex subunit gamma, mitochondrial-like [Styela clava]|uniref:ATP synthase subunit gamma, mitochondrial-like n=1 Tax=Styela clava TaxID=7725 RepID=UPI001939A2DE|nr:ATP synthase subunit gamma, mitochondrial-like [Styela clava]